MALRRVGPRPAIELGEEDGWLVLRNLGPWAGSRMAFREVEGGLEFEDGDPDDEMVANLLAGRRTKLRTVFFRVLKRQHRRSGLAARQLIEVALKEAQPPIGPELSELAIVVLAVGPDSDIFRDALKRFPIPVELDIKLSELQSWPELRQRYGGRVAGQEL